MNIIEVNPRKFNPLMLSGKGGDTAKVHNAACISHKMALDAFLTILIAHSTEMRLQDVRLLLT